MTYISYPLKTPHHNVDLVSYALKIPHHNVVLSAFQYTERRHPDVVEEYGPKNQAELGSSPGSAPLLVDFGQVTYPF